MTKIQITVPDITDVNPWMISTFVLAFALIFMFVAPSISSLTGSLTKTQSPAKRITVQDLQSPGNDHHSSTALSPELKAIMQDIPCDCGCGNPSSTCGCPSAKNIASKVQSMMDQGMTKEQILEQF